MISLLPFNALATSHPLWPSLLRMVDDQWQEWHSVTCPYSLSFRLSDRFHLNDWTPAAIRKNPAAFLTHETSWMRTSTNQQRGYVAVLDEQTIIGEGSFAFQSPAPAVTDMFVTLSRPHRSHGHASSLIEAMCAQAARNGHRQVHTGIRQENTASRKALQPLLDRGVARHTHDSRSGSFFTIDLHKLA